MSEQLKKAEDIARKLKLEISTVPQDEVLEHLNRSISQLPPEYRAIVDNFVSATIIYGQIADKRDTVQISAVPPRHSPEKAQRPHHKNRIMWAATILIAAIGASLFYLNQSEADLPDSSIEGLQEFRASERKHLLIFVHGVRDDGSLTWTNQKSGANWLEIVAEDTRFDEFDLATYRYSSMLFRSDNLSISNIADQFAFRLNGDPIRNYEKIVFVAHSMGGLVVRNMLLKNQKLSQKVPLIFFLATPTSGSDIARLAKQLEPSSSSFLAMPLSWFGFESNHLDAMTSFEESNFLQDQSSAWRRSNLSTQIHSLCAFEGARTNGVLVVEQASAESLCTGSTIPTGETHSSIAKPSSEKSIVHSVFASRVEEIMEELNAN